MKKLFSPDRVLNRQTAATMLTRVYKKCALEYEMPSKLFTDDSKIASWAYDSVYFMAANNVITGYPEGDFRPVETVSGESAVNYATRQQTLIMAVRMVENLGK